MSPRPNVSAQRKAQILDAATAIFAQKGFQKNRMDDLVQETGLSKGTLYWYFKSKDDLIIALLNRIFEREMHDLHQLKTAEGSARERLLQFTEALIADLETWLKLVPIAYEYLGLIFRRKIVQQTFHRYLQTYVDLAIPIIQDGLDKGEFRPIDAKEVALTVAAIFEGTILLWVYDHDAVNVEQQIRAGIQILQEGIKA